MRSWTGQRIWRKWSGRLASAEEDEFERLSLPFLRLFWPSIQQTPRKKSWDARGIDLFTWTEKGNFPCVVQCKGFKVQSLDSAQIRQAVLSINKFLESDVSAETYILLHNRDGRHDKFNDAVTIELAKLVAAGKARSAELWDRQFFLNRTFDRMQEIVDSALRDFSRYLLQHFEALFTFGQFYLPAVPFTEARLTFRRGFPCIVEPVRDQSPNNLRDALLTVDTERWTLLTGRFGTGKTANLLHAVNSSDRPTVFVPCALLAPDSLMHGTNLLLEEVIKSLDLLEDFADADREVLTEIAGPVFSYLLRQPQSPYCLILDALDENRAYANLSGLQTLSNQLAELSCQIMMTTRSEHVSTMFGDFSVAFDEFSTKHGRNRHARLLELQLWDAAEVLKLLDTILHHSQESQLEHVKQLRHLVESGRYSEYYGELPRQPLFLQFILEDVVEHGIRPAYRTTLLRDWVTRKIRLDRKSWAPAAKSTRVLPGGTTDTEAFIENTVQLMEEVSYLMVERDRVPYALVEGVQAGQVRTVADRTFSMTSDPLMGILLNSVLVARSLRRVGDFRIGFAFRIFQEYFLASRLVRILESEAPYPEEVRLLCTEIRSEGAHSATTE
jgi:hypothetical protein